MLNNAHEEYYKRSEQWARVRDALEGEDAIKSRGVAYLPRPEAQSPVAYKSYLSRSCFFSVTERTLRGLTGLVFRNPPIIDLPPRIEYMIESATSLDYSLYMLAHEMVREVLSVGRYGILLDVGSGGKGYAEPYISCYYAENITNWEMGNDLNGVYLKSVSLKEDEKLTRRLHVDDGIYKVSIIEDEQEVEVYEPSINGRNIDYIPFTFVGPYDLRPEIKKPPMIDLVNLNIAHYRNSADYEQALYLTAQPTPWISGIASQDDSPNSIGSGAIWYLPEGASAGMLEFSGAGIEAQRLAMQDKENMMAALGAVMIHDGKVRNESATTARLRGRGELSLLNSAVIMCEQAIKRCLMLAAEWSLSDPKDVRFSLNKDWTEARMEPQELTALMKAWQSGAISRATFHDNLQRGEIVPSNRSVDDEIELINLEDRAL